MSRLLTRRRVGRCVWCRTFPPLHTADCPRSSLTDRYGSQDSTDADG